MPSPELARSAGLSVDEIRSVLTKLVDELQLGGPTTNTTSWKPPLVQEAPGCGDGSTGDLHDTGVGIDGRRSPIEKHEFLLKLLRSLWFPVEVVELGGDVEKLDDWAHEGNLAESPATRCSSTRPTRSNSSPRPRPRTATRSGYSSQRLEHHRAAAAGGTGPHHAHVSAGEGSPRRGGGEPG